MRTKYRPWAKPYIEEHPEASFELEKLKGMKDLHIEIGAGKGNFILALAAAHEDTFYLAVERNVSCAGAIAKKIVENEVNNARLIYDDILHVLDYLDDGSVKIFYLNFSDPWPKKKHTKRRLTYPTLIEKYVAKLEVGGEIRFKTDNDELYEFSRETFQVPSLELIEDTPNYETLAEDDFMTEYEEKKRGMGLSIHRLVLRKR